MTSRRTKARRRAVRRRWLPGILIGVGAFAALLGVLIPMASARAPQPLCAADQTTYTDAEVAGWRGEQLQNAAVIMRTATALGFSRDAQILGVMTAMGESSLRNIDYGDWETSGVTNPDGGRTTSIGLFQQQAWWGSAAQRMDPATSAALFYERLGELEGWQQMEPTWAIHRVQINSDPEHYAQFEADAATVVAALSAGCATPSG